MALHNLRITVVDSGKAEGKWGAANKDDGALPTKDNKKSKLYKMLNFNQTIQGSIKKAVSPTTFFALQAGVNLAAQTARQFINYYVSDIGRKNGDSNHQAIVNRRIEQVTDGISIGTGALGGMAAGAALGVPGIIIGGLIGAASSGISLGFKYAERERAYAHEIFKDSTSQAYNLARAGNTALTGRLR